MKEYACQGCGERYTADDAAGHFSKCPACGGKLAWKPEEPGAR